MSEPTKNQIRLEEQNISFLKTLQGDILKKKGFKMSLSTLANACIGAGRVRVRKALVK